MDLVCQPTIENNEREKLKERGLEVYYGGKLDDLKIPLFGISYLYSLNEYLTHDFDIFGFKRGQGETNLYGVISTSLRYYYLREGDFKLYIQGGIGVSLFSIIPHLDFGLNYSAFFLDIRILVTKRSSITNNYLIFGLTL